MKSSERSSAPIASPRRGGSARRPAERFRLTGPSVTLDPRVHAVRRDIADIGLADRIFAPHYAAPQVCACTAPSTMLRDAPSENGRAVSQLLHGEGFAIVDAAHGWAWGYSLHDRYVGYVAQEALGAGPDPTHVVTAALALVFAAPDIKAPVVARWPIGARFAGAVADGFVATDAGYLHARHVAPLAEAAADPVTVAERLIGAPYLWGGRGAGGIDCSGLVQLSLALTGTEAPRDSDQQRALGEAIAADAPLRRGDLIFFPGHVGLMVDAERMIHANAYWMAVTVEPLADVVARLAPTHVEPIVARRRLA